MKQSRSTSFYKSVISTAVGFTISLIAQWFFLPLIGVAIALHQNITFAIIMTAISIGRGYIMERVFEFFGMRVRLPASILAIAAERQRQITVEGWTPEHDDEHALGEMAMAAASYAAAVHERERVKEHQIYSSLPLPLPSLWPWDRDWWKPQDNRRDLIRAGALIAAELDRIDRARKRRAPRPTPPAGPTPPREVTRWSRPDRKAAAASPIDADARNYDAANYGWMP